MVSFGEAAYSAAGKSSPLPIFGSGWGARYRSSHFETRFSCGLKRHTVPPTERTTRNNPPSAAGRWSSLAALWVRSPRSPRSFARTLSSLEGRQCRGRRAGPRAGRAVGTGRKGHVRGHVRSNFLIVHKSFPSHVPFSLTPLSAWRAAARTVVVPPITVFVFVPLRPRKKNTKMKPRC